MTEALSSLAHIHLVDDTDCIEQLAYQSLVFCELDSFNDLFEDLLFEPRVALITFLTA
jgi:hypothetical protein